MLLMRGNYLSVGLRCREETRDAPYPPRSVDLHSARIHPSTFLSNCRKTHSCLKYGAGAACPHAEGLGTLYLELDIDFSRRGDAI